MSCRLFLVTAALCFHGCRDATSSPPVVSVISNEMCNLDVVDDGTDRIKIVGQKMTFQPNSAYQLKGHVLHQNAKVGDVVTVSVKRVGKRDRLQTSANAMGKMTSDSSGNLTFSTELRLPDIHGDKFMLIPSFYDLRENRNIELAEINIAVDNSRPSVQE